MTGKKTLSGAKILLESLKAENVDQIFGYPGGVVLPIYDELYDFPIKHILTRHEQGAIHAADGYARVTGKPGVVLVTSGPGATNTVTGIANAFMDSIPLIVLTGQVTTTAIGNDAFQEADIVGITRPCTKHSYLVRDVKDMARVIREAFHIATTGKPGPVLIDLPKDVLTAETNFEYPSKVHLPGYNPTLHGHPRQVQKIAEAWSKAERPLMYVGGGAITSGAAKEMRELAKLTQTPVTMTLMGLGAVASDDPLCLGMCGMHGTYRANMSMNSCDLLLALGSRFDDRVTGKLDVFAKHAMVVHVDIDPSNIGKNVPADIPIVGDLKSVAEMLLTDIKKVKVDWKTKHGEWLKRIDDWRKTYPLKYKQEKGVIKPQYVLEEIARQTKGDAIFTTEVGQAQMWAAQYLDIRDPRTFVTSGGLGTMGYGFPAAIGAKAAFPKKKVVDIAGDGSIQMNIQELATSVQYGLPVFVAILNNGCLGMVRQWQELFYGKRYSQSVFEYAPDFVKLAEAYGAVGMRITDPAEVPAAVKKALASKTTVLADFVVAPRENVYPMIPAGAPLDNIILS